jgi:plasmid stability protein
VIYLGSLNIRDFPPDLLKKLKIKALEEDKTLRDLCIDLLTAGLKKKGGK